MTSRPTSTACRSARWFTLLKMSIPPKASVGRSAFRSRTRRSSSFSWWTLNAPLSTVTCTMFRPSSMTGSNQSVLKAMKCTPISGGLGTFIIPPCQPSTPSNKFVWELGHDQQGILHGNPGLKGGVLLPHGPQDLADHPRLYSCLKAVEEEADLFQPHHRGWQDNAGLLGPRHASGRIYGLDGCNEALPAMHLKLA